MISDSFMVFEVCVLLNYELNALELFSYLNQCFNAKFHRHELTI